MKENKVIDITIDFETVGLSPQSAILELAAVAWQRATEPHLDPNADFKPIDTFDSKVDLRSCVAAGMKFDQDTIDWWSRQKQSAKDHVLDGDCYPVRDVLDGFLDWLEGLYCQEGSPEPGFRICLWSQGSDFDISILRSLAATFGMTERLAKLVSYVNFRDARTFILEVGNFSYNDKLFGCPIEHPSDVYKVLPSFNDDYYEVHTAIRDALQTSWNVWHIMRNLDLRRVESGEQMDVQRRQNAILQQQYDELKAAYDMMQNNKDQD